ncbi:hypothetical protein [Mycobacterium sp. E2462]|uniref:hypothetical protein n=1 Tax=Mycobacterium sp. E2462 TaxID=1834133 RepID=UPI0012E9C94D|nr:hypothetical protein [Mycobacterium sp. E2462]
MDIPRTCGYLPAPATLVRPSHAPAPTSPPKAAMTSTIAVLFVHGVEIKDPHYADNAITLLRAEYARACRGMEAAELEIESAFWIPVVEPGLDKIVRATFGRGFAGWAQRLDGLVHRINNGSYLAMVPVVLSGLLGRIPGLPKAHWPTLRWAVTYFLGDVIAYQTAEGSDANYDAIHARLDDALATLAERAPDAPLCVIAHSLGTVVASDYFYDLQNAKPKQLKKSARGSSALQRGETLTWFYTLGSPIALWMVRYPEFDSPIKLPGRKRSAAARKAAQWINFHDPDDIVAYPLRTLNKHYAEAVDRDQAVSVGPPLLGDTPVSHVAYLNSRKVMRPIAQRLAMFSRPTE